ncbi:hypothetical protein PybrP1_013167 [[Pythium] brassicae (nom. inval.)]|nr:hypothetical protein PybrP1_013167 [[Pythium] brassicae (nom. inval.)]
MAMGEPVTVRLFVQTQTYDIPCDPRQPAQWLLLQAKSIQRANLKRSATQQQEHSPRDELEVLYNRTTRSVIELGEQIGRCISPMDVVDARTLLQTPDTTFNSAMFPWLRSYPGGLQLSEDSLNSANGLFFQQLYAYTLIGKRTPASASQRKEKQNREAFQSLLGAYVRGAFDDDGPTTTRGPRYQQPQQQRRSSSAPSQYGAHRPAPLAAATPTGTHSQYSSAQSPSYAAPPRRLDFPADAPSSSDSDTAEDAALPPLRVNATLASSPYHATAAATSGGYRSSVQSPTSPSLTVAGALLPAAARRPTAAGGSEPNPLDDMKNVFDIVFKQQSIGMKLGADETKQFAVVKECIDKSEAARYPEIQNGVVILAVNGQEVVGLSLARILYRLREAPRPVVVRFGRISSRQQQPAGTWG